VHALEFADYQAAVASFETNGSGDLDSDEEVHAALDDDAAVDQVRRAGELAGDGRARRGVPGPPCD